MTGKSTIAAVVCNHLWIYRHGRSECIRCAAVADDGRGLPYGHYAINGASMTINKLGLFYACPLCLSNINPRMIDGQLQILCAGPKAHDIAALGQAMTKQRRDSIIQKQEQDYHTVIDGLPVDLRKIIQKGDRVKCQ